MAEDLFTKFGLEVQSAPVELGKTYPLYGMITDIIETENTPVKCVVNFNILVTMNLLTPDKLEILRNRAFEPGIFITTIVKVNENPEDKNDSIKYLYEGECSTVVFGKQQKGLEV
jgi:hypothetical protein